MLAAASDRGRGTFAITVTVPRSFAAGSAAAAARVGGVVASPSTAVHAAASIADRRDTAGGSTEGGEAVRFQQGRRSIRSAIPGLVRAWQRQGYGSRRGAGRRRIAFDA